jgi:hypothetical protein
MMVHLCSPNELKLDDCLKQMLHSHLPELAKWHWN